MSFQVLQSSSPHPSRSSASKTFSQGTVPTARLQRSRRKGSISALPLEKSYCLLPQWYDQPIFAHRNFDTRLEGGQSETVADGSGGGFESDWREEKLPGEAGSLEMSCRGPEDEDRGRDSLSGDALVRMSGGSVPAVRDWRWAFQMPSAGRT